MAKKEKKKVKDKKDAKKPKTDPKKDKNKKKGKNKKKDGKKTDELTTSDPEELLLTTDPETDVEDQQYTDTSYSSASFESLPPPPVEEKPKKKRKKRKETVEETITRVSSEVWSEDSFPFEPDEAAQAVIEEEVVRKKKKKKKGRKGKKGKKVKEVKEEIPKFPKPKKWKKMNKKERDQWMEQQIEEWRQQKEIEKAAFIAGAKERRKEEARQRAEVLANDNAEQEIRKDILQKTCNLFHSFEKEKILYANNKQMKEEWHQYLRCDGLPDPRVVTQAATYLHVWREQQQWGGEELARRCEETLPMLEMLETFVANARHYSPQQAENYNEIRLALREQLHHTIQHVSYMLLRDLETNLTAHSIKLATYEKEFKGLQLNFWVAIRMPTRKPKPVETEPEPIELSFPSMKVTVTLPKVVDASCACVRAAKYMLDLLSESSRTYRLAEEPEDWYEDLYSFNVREHEAVTALSSEQEATRKDFFKAVKARVKELEGLIKANIYVRNKAAEEELEELSLKEPQGLGDPRAFIVQQNELEFADYLKRCNYRTRRGEINLRKYRICGGIIQIDLLETPPQPKRMRDDIDITTLPLPKRLQPMSYQVQYRAPSPPPPGVTRTPEEIEAEMRKIEAEYEKLALVHIDLPQDVMWLEPPVVVQWQESRRLWTTNYVNDFKYNEDKLTVQFRTGILWPIGLATLRYSNLPYQGWDIKPDPNGERILADNNEALRKVHQPSLGQHGVRCSKSGVIVLVTGVSVTISWLCVGNYVKLRSITNATTPALKEHLNKKYTVKKMVQIMRLAACDVFPGSDAHAHVEGARKQPALERHTYHAMAFLSRAYNFQWSRWNMGAGSRNIVMQIREAVDKKRQGKFQLINVSTQRATLLKCTEVSTEYSAEPILGMQFHPDLFTFNMSYGSSDARRHTYNMKYKLVETVFELLQEVKLCSFS